jgi:broad specificity phosphatase PhoE
MKIGLVRHFKVKLEYPKKYLVSFEEVIMWFNDYDLADIEYQKVSLYGITWKRCFSSSTARAINTAKAIFEGEIAQTDNLKELEILSLMRSRLKLPFLVWAIVVRLKSFLSSKPMNEFKHRINMALDSILTENNEDTLIVSHVFVMIFLKKELQKRGFRGETFRSAENGKVYVFEK